MTEFRGKVAVVTGAASGLGRAMARQCAAEGMKVVLSDIEEVELLKVRDELSAAGATVVALRTDVTRLADVEALARETVDRFGGVHLFWNNAGVWLGGTPIWESPINDWRWVTDVNLWGVIHGIHVFVPLMLKQEFDSHIVMTASMAGLVAFTGGGIYRMTKQAVVSLSETLHYAFAEMNAPVKVSVLCPGWVRTRLLDSDRNRPSSAGAAPDAPVQTHERRRASRQDLENGMLPETVVEHAFQAIRDQAFYVVTHAELKTGVAKRMEDIIEGRNPTVSPSDRPAWTHANHASAAGRERGE